MAKGGMHVLGLDIGTSAIKAAELQVSGGEVYLVGSTGSTDLPVTPAAAQRTLAGTTDGFVIRLVPGR